MRHSLLQRTTGEIGDKAKENKGLGGEDFL